MTMPIWTRGIPNKKGYYWCVPSNDAVTNLCTLPLLIEYTGCDIHILNDEWDYSIKDLGEKAVFLEVIPPTSYTVAVSSDYGADSITKPIKEET